MSVFYDRNSKQLTVEEWAKLFEDMHYKRVAVTNIGERVSVSTVWLGLDHNFGLSTPIVFETLVFGGAFDGEMQRYATEEEALRGHEEMVTRCGGQSKRIVEI